MVSIVINKICSIIKKEKTYFSAHWSSEGFSLKMDIMCISLAQSGSTKAVEETQSLYLLLN